MSCTPYIKYKHIEYGNEQIKVNRKLLKIFKKDLKHGRRRVLRDGGNFRLVDLRPDRRIMREKARNVKEKGKIISGDSHEAKWNRLPQEILLKIFQFLSAECLIKVSQVCRMWNSVGQDASLWRNVEITIGGGSDATPQSLIQYILKYHRQHLTSVIFKTDSSKESAEKVCQILRELVNCSLRTLALISCTTPVFLDIDHEVFTSALTVVFDYSDAIRNLTVDYTPIDDPSLKTLARKHYKSLQLLKMKSCPRVSSEGFLALAHNCLRLSELSLNYTLLSDDILRSLSSEQHVKLTNLRIDVFTDPTMNHKNKISPPSWQALINHSPNMNLIMYFFVVDCETYDTFFHSYNPVSHLYFCEYVPKNVLQRISKNCPRIKELVVNGTDGPTIDFELIDLGIYCDKLTSIGLSNCYVTCSAFVEFVRISRKRLSELFISEDCLIQSLDYDLQRVIVKVSELLDTDWEPEFMPLW